MKRTLKVFLVDSIKEKYYQMERIQIKEIECVPREGKLTLARLDSNGRTWINPTYTLEQALPIPKDVRKLIVELENAHIVFQKELDYLSHFLSVILRSNVPEEVIYDFIPPHVFKAFKEDDDRNCISLRRAADESITTAGLKKQYPTETFFLNKYLIYLML